ncbi:putative iron-sulfur cluster-binding metallochaperone [Psychrobacillus sp.]|uniref:putative iron-sulfur cluster-binding metallochaperone n=1 Tax=Psychrobacillus sp. TaxID=1871623 RepID=UPI0028BE0298|nr:(2Fe-2S)-binding protein [Psychrobacillus sp.]
MTDCCASKEQIVESNGYGLCPSCNNKGKKTGITTLKSMLKPSVLDSSNTNLTHYFCSTKDCDVVYFDTEEKFYLTSDVKVSVYQKDDSSTVPICYCFGWTREKIREYEEQKLFPKPLEHIKENVKANRCGCEVNNPQGSCCMGNVLLFTKSL